MSCTTGQEAHPVGLSQRLGVGLFRIPGESFCTFNNRTHLMQKQKVTTGKTGGYREGGGRVRSILQEPAHAKALCHRQHGCPRRTVVDFTFSLKTIRSREACLDRMDRTVHHSETLVSDPDTGPSGTRCP